MNAPWDDSLTLILSRSEAVALSMAILETASSGQRGEALENVRKKLRSGLDHGLKAREEELLEASLIAMRYSDVQRRGCNPVGE